jgi:hypothetical protein
MSATETAPHAHHHIAPSADEIVRVSCVSHSYEVDAA